MRPSALDSALWFKGKGLIRLSFAMKYYSARSRYVVAPPRLKPSRAVRFPNDIVFQDHIRQGDLEQVGRFIRASKVKLDTIYPSGMAALHEAVLTGNLDCVKLLLKHGADIEQRDENGWTALHVACSDGHMEVAKYLLSEGAQVDALNDDGELPVHLIDPDAIELRLLFEP
ncbi:protein phosphatase 1 regulatory subunit 27 [Narcine bancroftii]|uniref:protein phosphatase 1 regulatory subunit 27 n=1 Tax=Narcine bancroftii TaxID=1343680 RepID=UPI003831D926